MSRQCPVNVVSMLSSSDLDVWELQGLDANKGPGLAGTEATLRDNLHLCTSNRTQTFTQTHPDPKNDVNNQLQVNLDSTWHFQALKCQDFN